MCFLWKKIDNEFYQLPIHDTPHLFSWLVFNLHKYSEAIMRRAIVTAWQGFLQLKGIHSFLIRTLGFSIKEWQLNFRGNKKNSIVN